ncbi:hypothetical protein GCM10007977_088230 [Dactylosporangium sucinum]|uniref:Uncharacterized protein n=1 Tax=Dactylosporangium sucinum TaxID=1424081 RepID=A0A917UDS9_9ACTN|nr:hypothetical protein GCM10007977_088230 [Dactylosporangium sucinum]
MVVVLIETIVQHLPMRVLAERALSAVEPAASHHVDQEAGNVGGGMRAATAGPVRAPVAD